MSDLPARPQPYRSAAMLHAGLAAVILVVAAVSGGSIPKAIAVAGAYFVLATAWSWFRFRQRARPTPNRDENG